MKKAKERKQARSEIVTENPGYFGSQDNVYVGTLKGAGHIYQQTFKDIYSRIVVDGNSITSRRSGTAMEFALKLVEILYGDQQATGVSQSIPVDR